MDTPHLKWTAEGRELAYQLSDDETLIGRLSESDVVLSNPFISRQHAKVLKQGNGFTLVDLNSLHGSYVNGVQISEQSLRNGDRITLGREQVDILFFTGPDEAFSSDSTLGDEDLEKSIMQPNPPNSRRSHTSLISNITGAGASQQSGRFAKFWRPL